MATTLHYNVGSAYRKTAILSCPPAGDRHTQLYLAPYFGSSNAYSFYLLRVQQHRAPFDRILFIRSIDTRQIRAGGFFYNREPPTTLARLLRFFVFFTFLLLYFCYD